LLTPARNCVHLSEGAIASDIPSSELIELLRLFDRLLISAQPGKEPSTLCPSYKERRIELKGRAALLQRLLILPGTAVSCDRERMDGAESGVQLDRFCHRQNGFFTTAHGQQPNPQRKMTRRIVWAKVQSRADFDFSRPPVPIVEKMYESKPNVCAHIGLVNLQ